MLLDRSSPKKATNVSINAELLKEARALHINLSQTLEQRLLEIVSTAKRQQWLQENQTALQDYNRRVETRGVFSDGLRHF